MNASRILAAAALLFGLTTAASADPLMSDNCRVDVHCFEGTNGVYAMVQVDATWGLTIDGDLHLTVNNQEIKVEPVLTNSRVYIYTWVAPSGRTLNACARVVGRNLTTGDNWMPADSTDCTFYSLEQDWRSQPIAPGPRPPIAGADPLARVRR